MTSVDQSPGIRLEVDHEINNERGPWIYKIKDSLHYIAGSLVPTSGNNSCFAQLYIYDPIQALEHHMQFCYNTGLDQHTV